jgi:LAS superfamily LD-carboxypeptidase LdcB
MGKFFTKEVIAVAVLVLLAGVSFGGYRFWITLSDLRGTKTSLFESQNKVKTLEEENKVLNEANTRLQEDIFLAKNEKADLSATLSAEQNKNSIFESQIQAIGSTVGTLGNTVGTLEKLSKTDKELLQKYSKVYFLNEHYIPSNLSDIASTSVYEKGKVLQIHAKVSPYLVRMMDAVAATGTALQIISAYRSFDSQASLKSSYKITYGTGANRFSADQGYSEHQLGTTLDFTTVKLGAAFNQFAETKAYLWLMENAYQYGFVLSYPKNNTYYQFEPWHWRFVGVALATKLHNDSRYFYDLDQREIDSYLVSIFD